MSLAAIQRNSFGTPTMPRKKSVEIGPMSGNSGGVPHYVPPRVAFDAPARITNSSAKGTYSEVEAHKGAALRPGCLQAFSLPSRGVRC
jgi:hypothetical protein